MKNKRYKVMVIEPNIKDRVTICNWLSDVGFSVYECRDSYNAIHFIRKVKPDIAFINTETKDIHKVVDIVESNRLSKIIFISDSSNVNLKKLRVGVTLKNVVKKPLKHHQVINCIKNGLNIKGIDNIESKVIIDMERMRIVNHAKEVLMSKMGYSEEQAYIFLRKNSMDHSKSIVIISEIIIKSFNQE